MEKERFFMKKIIGSRVLFKVLYGVIIFYFGIYKMLMELTAESIDVGAGFFTGVVFTVLWVLSIQGAGFLHDFIKELIVWIKDKRNKHMSA